MYIYIYIIFYVYRKVSDWIYDLCKSEPCFCFCIGWRNYFSFFLYIKRNCFYLLYEKWNWLHFKVQEFVCVACFEV